MLPPSSPRLLPSGDSALTVEFGDTIDPGLSARVLALDAEAGDIPGVVETVPTYRSLLVVYDPQVTGFERLGAALTERAAGLAPRSEPGRTWRVPVCYGGEHGIDLEATAALHGIDAAELVRRHSAPTYRVYMLGFLPGFVYLGGLDQSIATPRRVSPRLRTPPGTISIGGVQAIVASLEAPSGFHLLGRTPVRNFMPDRDPAVIIGAGDELRFEAIDAAEFDRLDRAAAAGEPVAEVLP